MVEFWRAGGPTDGSVALEAQQIEELGWDGQTFMDSQSLGADPYALMGAWAVRTSHLKLGIGVANPFTRNLAVTASAAATVQVLSGGRAVLGFGRGDSSLAWLGYAPVRLAAFERALVDLQTLLRGEAIPFVDASDGKGPPPAHTLSFGARPEAVRINWLPADVPKVPLDVAATGPKVIAMAAPIAEQLTFSVGADPEKVEWALNVARAARAAKGLAATGISYGAQILVICHPDYDTAMERAMFFAPPMVRFQVMQGTVAVPQREGDAANLDVVHKGYDMTKHGDSSATEHLTSGNLTPDFVRRFAVVGTPDQCTARLLELIRAGLERFVIVGSSFLPPEWGEARDLIPREVLPAVRKALSSGA